MFIVLDSQLRSLVLTVRMLIATGDTVTQIPLERRPLVDRLICIDTRILHSKLRESFLLQLLRQSFLTFLIGQRLCWIVQRKIVCTVCPDRFF